MYRFVFFWAPIIYSFEVIGKYFDSTTAFVLDVGQVNIHLLLHKPLNTNINLNETKYFRL